MKTLVATKSPIKTFIFFFQKPQNNLFNNKSRELINQPKRRERTRKSKILILNNSTFLFIFTYLIPATIKFHKTFKGLRKIKCSFHYTKMRFTFFCDSFKRHWELMFYNSLINLSLSFVSATQLHFIYVLKKNWKTEKLNSSSVRRRDTFQEPNTKGKVVLLSLSELPIWIFRLSV